MSKKEALKIHGYIFSSDSEDSYSNESNSISDFDAKYLALKPPPLSPETLKNRSVRVTKKLENKKKIPEISNFRQYQNKEDKNTIVKDNVKQRQKQKKQKSKRHCRSAKKRNVNKDGNSKDDVKWKHEILPKKENIAAAVNTTQNSLPYTKSNQNPVWNLRFETFRSREVVPYFSDISSQKDVTRDQKEDIANIGIHKVHTRTNNVMSIKLQNDTSGISITNKTDNHEENKSVTCKSCVERVCAQKEFSDATSHVRNINVCKENCGEKVDTVSNFESNTNKKEEIMETVDVHNVPSKKNMVLVLPQADTSGVLKPSEINTYEEEKLKVHSTCIEHNTTNILKEFENTISFKDEEEKYHFHCSHDKKCLHDKIKTVNYKNVQSSINSAPRVVKSNQVQPTEENRRIESLCIIDNLSLREKNNLEDVYSCDICYFIRKCFGCQDKSAT